MEALDTDPTVVQRFFGVHGSGSASALSYVISGSEARAGDYEVNVTQVATRGETTSVGFAGAYADDGAPDVLTIRDLGSEAEYDVSLTNGMTLVEIIDPLNTEFETQKAHEVQAGTALFGDATGTAAVDATLLQDLFNTGGSSLGVADGDVITISGIRANGSSFSEDCHVTDVSSQTLGDLRSAVVGAVGGTEVVTWEGGALKVSALQDGSSSLAFSITSDNAGGGSLGFGTMDVITAWRGTARITASDSGGQLLIQHDEYGSVAGFDVAFTPGGSDGSASLGLAVGSYAGLDVEGTIGGLAATGAGQFLTGAEDTSIEGLMIRYDGADTGFVWDMLFSRGVASAVETLADLYLGSGEGSIDGIVDNIDPLIDRLNDRIDNLEMRLDQRREFLNRKFARLEEALALAQSQAEWLTSQFANLPKYNQTN